MKDPFIFISIAFILFSLSGTAFASNALEYEEAKWDVVLKMAEEQNKPIFVKTYASYCAPCKHMDKHVFSSPTLSEFYNANFINYKVDMQSELGNIFNLAYEVHSIPDMLFFNPKGEIIARAKGGQSITDMMHLGKEALEKADLPIKSSPIYVHKKQYKTTQDNSNWTASTQKTKTKKTFTPKKTRNNIYYDAAESINRFLKKQRSRLSTLYTTQNMDYIYQNASNLQSDAMDLLLRRKQDFADRYGWENIDNLIRQSVLDATFEAVVYKDNQLFDKCINTLRKSDLPDKQEQMFKARMMFYEGIGDWSSYSRTVDWYLHATSDFNRSDICVAAWKMYENTSDIGLLGRASRWIEQSIELDDRFYNNNVYAHLLQKMGRHKKARKVALYAINLAKNEGRDYSDLEILLDRIISLK